MEYFDDAWYKCRNVEQDEMTFCVHLWRDWEVGWGEGRGGGVAFVFFFPKKTFSCLFFGFEVDPTSKGRQSSFSESHQ